MMTEITEPIKRKNIFAFDIETYGDKNKFLMGSIYGYDVEAGITRPFVFWDKLEMLGHMRKRKDDFKDSFIFATNLEFDIFALVSDTEYIENISPLFRKSQLISAKLRIDGTHKNNVLRFVDSMNYAPFGVEKLGKIIGINKLPHPRCLGKRPRDREEALELERYNINDSLITYKAACFFQDSFNYLGAEMKQTIAATGLNLFQRKFLDEPFMSPHKNYLDMMFQGYYGGRTEIFKRGLVKKLKYYDVNALYPFVMQREYPHPNKFYHKACIDKIDIVENEGICRVKMLSPCYYIPYLPYRIEHKLIFPSGRLDGWYTFFEIRKAIELGYNIEKLHDGIIYPKTFSPFKEYVNYLYKKRLEFQKENNPMETVAKLLSNSLYGKFGQKEIEDIKYVHENKVTKEMLDKNEFEHIGEFFAIKSNKLRYARYVNPIFSMYTTAYARDHLYTLFSKSFKDIYYCDTDSLMTRKDYDTDDKLGSLKLVETMPEAVLVKPKFYLTPKGAKCKGVRRLDEKEFYNLLLTKSVSNIKFSKFKESLRRGLSYNEKIEVIKELDIEDNKRIWEGKFNIEEVQDSNSLYL